MSGFEVQCILLQELGVGPHHYTEVSKIKE